MKICPPIVFSDACLVLAGCSLPQPQADTVRNFTLGGLAGAVPVDNPTHVRPVEVAGDLRRREMAVRLSEHEVTYLDDIRWAGPLDEAITQLLRDRLCSVPGGATVTVHVQRCELVRPAGNTVQLTATYSIVPADGIKGHVREGVFSATPRKWDGQDYGALVGLMHDAVVDLGGAIAAAVQEGN